jgi:putative transposase
MATLIDPQPLTDPSDLTDQEWWGLAPLLPAARPGGRPRSVDLRRVLTGLFSLVRSGCAWRSLPRDYGPWSTVYHDFRTWRNAGVWEQVHPHLRELARRRAGRNPSPSAAMIASQSVKTHQGGPRGFDGGKKVSGRQRQLLVDTLGLLLKVVVHPANRHDRLGAKLVLGALGNAFPRRQHLWADQGYEGYAGVLRQWTAEPLGIELEVVYPWWHNVQRYLPEGLDEIGFQPGFHVLPRRWVVERTIAWLGRSRRLSKDYERLPSSSEALIDVTSIRLLLVRLAQNSR